MRGDHYGVRVVAWHVAHLLHGLHNKVASFDGLLTEGRENAVWDDLVVGRGPRTDWWQVKRQLTPLASDDLKEIVVNAQTIQANGRDNNFRIAFRELKSVHFPQPKTGKRTASKYLELSHLQQLCADAAAPGMQANALVADTSVPYKDWWPELSGWLGTSDPDALQKIVRRFEIIQLGDEAQLKFQATNWLTPFFEYPESVFADLVQFFTDYPDGRIKVTPGLLMSGILAAHPPRTGSSIWFELGLSGNGLRWEIRSVRPLREIARQSWVENCAVELTYTSPPERRDEVTSQLTRLALHSNITTSVHAASTTEWSAHASRSCFETLGTDQSALCSITGIAHSAGHLPPLETLLPKELADRLAGEMNELLWSSLAKAVVKRATALPIESQLRTSILTRWDQWIDTFAKDDPLRYAFLVRLVATQAELMQPEFDAQARTGPTIVANAADACLLAAAVAEAFHPGSIPVSPGIHGTSGNLFLGGISAHLTAVSHAFDSHAHTVCSVSSRPYAALSVEPNIVLLGGVAQDATILRQFWEDDASVFSDPGTASTLEKSGMLPLIPYSDAFRRALQAGLPSLQKHIGGVLGPVVDHEYSALKAAIAGATT